MIMYGVCTPVCLYLLVCIYNFYLYFVTDDHSRVVLEPLPNDPNSDYINANFVDVSIEIQSTFLCFSITLLFWKMSYMPSNSVPRSSLFFEISRLTAWTFQYFYSLIWRVTTGKRRTLHHKVRQLTQATSIGVIWNTFLLIMLENIPIQYF